MKITSSNYFSLPSLNFTPATTSKITKVAIAALLGIGLAAACACGAIPPMYAIIGGLGLLAVTGSALCLRGPKRFDYVAAINIAQKEISEKNLKPNVFDQLPDEETIIENRLREEMKQSILSCNKKPCFNNTITLIAAEATKANLPKEAYLRPLSLLGSELEKIALKNIGENSTWTSFNELSGGSSYEVTVKNSGLIIEGKMSGYVGPKNPDEVCYSDLQQLTILAEYNKAGECYYCTVSLPKYSPYSFFA